MDPPTHYTYMSFMTTLCTYSNFHASGNVFCKCWSVSVGVSVHLTMTDAGHHSLHFTSVLKVFDDGSEDLPHQKLSSHTLMDLALFFWE